MFELKPDFEEVLERYEAWWNCEIVDRPLVCMGFRVPEADRKSVTPKQFTTPRDRWLDTEYVAACAEAGLSNGVHFADKLPIAWPNLGPEVFSAFYGCKLEYGERTAWSEPILDDWSEDSVKKLQLDKDCFYYKKLIEMTDALLEVGKGKFIVGYTDLHGGGDAIAAFRDPQNLLMDTIEHPEAIKKLNDRITTDFLAVYDEFHAKLSAAGMPSTSWCHATCEGKYHIPSCDVSCMMSDDMFEELFIPGIMRECKHMDRCIYHLDGPQALRYLDRLLDIPDIHAIQWVPGAGNDQWVDQIEVYQRIQAKGKAMQLPGIPAEDLDRLFEVLSPEGVWISGVGGIRSREDAESALKKISGWTKKR